MHYKKSGLGKKGNIFHISAFALVFSFISIIYIFMALFGFGVANDYLFFELQNITEQLEEQGIVSTGTSARTQEYGDDFTNFNFHLDDIWLISYLVFIGSSIAMAYQTRKQGYFTALGYLFYFVMFILFLLTTFVTLTNWFNAEILEKVFPLANIVVPKFYFYLNNIGIFTAIQLVLLIVINQIDFDFSKIVSRRKKEKAAMEDDEVI